MHKTCKQSLIAILVFIFDHILSALVTCTDVSMYPYLIFINNFQLMDDVTCVFIHFQSYCKREWRNATYLSCVIKTQYITLFFFQWYNSLSSPSQFVPASVQKIQTNTAYLYLDEDFSHHTFIVCRELYFRGTSKFLLYQTKQRIFLSFRFHFN